VIQLWILVGNPQAPLLRGLAGSVGNDAGLPRPGLKRVDRVVARPVLFKCPDDSVSVALVAAKPLPVAHGLFDVHHNPVCFKTIEVFPELDQLNHGASSLAIVCLVCHSTQLAGVYSEADH